MSADLVRLSAVAGALLGAGTVESSGGGLLPEEVSPGVIGFLVTLALVLACIPLFRSMTSKLRGVQHRDEPGELPGDAGRAADETTVGGTGTAPGPDVG